MTTEERLVTALRHADEYEPSPDLWNRVLYSIEEDRSHRRRLWRTGGAVLAVLVLAAVVGYFSSLNVGRSDLRAHVDWRVLEALETVVLVGLIATLGPAIRRFGRGYANEIFSTSPNTATLLLRLLDVAYYLVFFGYLLLTVRFAAPDSFLLPRLGLQIYEALARVGGLLLAMGLMHAVTFMVLPLVALVFNSTNARRALPRWVTLALIVGGALASLMVLFMLLGAVGG